MARINKTIREQAAMICAIQASSPIWRGWPYRIAENLGYPEYAAAVSVQAWLAAYDDLPNAYAEAEALLRTGWVGPYSS